MTVHVHRLEGCAPQPLAHYLKALAILRLVSEQADPDARGWWKDEAFQLATRLTREQLIDFFLNDYEPTPILSPWNGGSGFFFREGKSGDCNESGTKGKTGVRDVETTATKTITHLVESQSPRLALYRQAAAHIRGALAAAGLDAAPEGEDKAALIARLRSTLDAASARWIDSTVLSEGTSIDCAPLLGTGGNDGNEDFSQRFLQTLLDWMEDGGLSSPRTAIRASLFAEPTPGKRTAAPGLLWPGGNGGVNAGEGFSGKAIANPIDFVLAIEGSIAVVGALTRTAKSTSEESSFPFTVRVDPAGYFSASEEDRASARFEIWLPQWGQPATFTSVRSVLAEGRARTGRKGAVNTSGVARAIASLGVARGITAFERFAFFQRHGKMYYGAQVGRWDARVPVDVRPLDDVVHWIDRYRVAARSSSSGSIERAVHRLEESVLGACKSAGPMKWQQLLIALGWAEDALLASPRTAGDPKRRLTPIPPLRPEWITRTNDGSIEHRLAVALASQDVALRDADRECFQGIRAHFAPLDRSRGSRAPHSRKRPPYFAVDAHGLAHDSDVVCRGRNLVDLSLRLLRRRLVLSGSLTTPGLGIVLKRDCAASLSDVLAFIDGAIDDAKLLSIARGLMAIDWSQSEVTAETHTSSFEVDGAYAAVRLVYANGGVRVGSEHVSIPIDPEPLVRLAAGNLVAAMTVALRRLRASGLQPKAHFFVADPERTRRIAASLVFPISPHDTDRCLQALTKPLDTEEPIHAR